MILKSVVKSFQVITMNIKHGFLPCAGFGSRMGNVGKVLPKPLWRVFDKTLLELQYCYLRDHFNIENFSINTHHLFEQFEGERASKIYEENLLGSGGNIHNLKKTFPHLEKVMVSNPDVFIFLSSNDLNSLKKVLGESDHVLVCLPVSRGGQYNEVNIDERGFFSHVSPPNEKKDYFTYSGLGMINLSKINYTRGKSSFFDTVVNDKSPCKVFTPKEPYEYWDWGTLELYTKNILSLSDKENDTDLKSFLINNDALQLDKLSKSSYFSVSTNSFNFTDKRELGLNNEITMLSSLGNRLSVKI